MAVQARTLLVAVVTAAIDVFVAGAGPAGSLAALHLARRGLRVVLADRSAFPRDKVCGCCLSGLALSALDAAGLGDLPDRLGAPRLRTVEVAAGGRVARIALPVGRALSRPALDHALVRAAEEAGVSFRPGLAARLLSVGPAGARIRLGAGEELLAGVAIAADGIGGSFLGDLPGMQPEIAAAARIGAGAVVETDALYGPGTIFMNVADAGYVGLTRLEDGRLDIAACLDPGEVRRSGGPGPLVAEILERSGRPPVAEVADARFRGTPTLTRCRSEVAAERIFVVGDAAAYVEPFTGEGMGWAMSGAGAVAPLVAAAVRGWDPALAERWRRRHARIVLRRQAVCRAVASLLRRPILTRAAVRVLQAAPDLARPLIAHLNAPPKELAA